MTDIIPIHIAIEDALSASVVRRLFHMVGRPYAIGMVYGGEGCGYLKRTIRGFNNAAKGTPFLVLTDLDRAECPPSLISEWLGEQCHPNMLFRIAVREVESWLLADRENFSRFLGIRQELIPTDTDRLEDPKAFLINLASKSKQRSLKEDLVPRPHSTSKQGPNYNGCLVGFVDSHWDALSAQHCSDSLRGAIAAITGFTPTYSL